MLIIQFLHDFSVCRNVNSSNKNTREVMCVNIRRYSKIDAVNITIWRERRSWISGFHTCVSLYHAAHKLLHQIHSYQMLKSNKVHQNCGDKPFFITRSLFEINRSCFILLKYILVTCLKFVIFDRNKGYERLNLL